jgi:hypothetical protein
MVFKIPCLTFPRDTQPVSIGHQQKKKKKNGLIITQSKALRGQELALGST